MRKILLIFIFFSGILYSENLQYVYDSASSGEGFDKLIILDKDSIYYGGFSQDVLTLCIHGNSAIIDLQGDTINIDGQGKILNIDHCVIKGALDVAIFFKNNSSGHIINNTFYGLNLNEENTHYALYFRESLGASIIKNNIFYGFHTSLFSYSSSTDPFFNGLSLEIEYNLHYECQTPYLYWAGWTGLPHSFWPNPGNGEKLENPDLIEPENNNFNLLPESNCIDSGQDTEFEYSGNAPDIGACESLYKIFRGTKLTGNISENLIKSKSPYIIYENINIISDSKVKIEPGVKIRVNNSKEILVSGELDCSGTVNDSIEFCSNSIYRTFWGTIRYFPEASKFNKIDYTKIIGGRIITSNDSVTIQNANIYSNIYYKNACNPNLQNNIFYNSLIECSEHSNAFFSNNSFNSTDINSYESNIRLVRNSHVNNSSVKISNHSIAYLEANFFTNNSSAISIDESFCESYNNLLINCPMSYDFRNNSTGRVINNTIYSDCNDFPGHSKFGYGVGSSNNSNPEVINSILYTIGEYNRSFHTYDSSKVFTKYCLLSTDLDGENNIYEEPCFTDDFKLESNSPCIDTGDPDTSGLKLPLFDYGHSNRITNGRIDIGCYENNLTDAIHPDTYTYTLNDKFILLQNYPNPFNPVTTIYFSITKNTHVKLIVINSIGQIVDVIIDKNMNKGKHSIKWDASTLPSGIYYYHLKANNYQKTNKCVLLK